MKANILVVDDEQDLCEILRFNLEGEDFAVSTACSAEDALETMGSLPQKHFDLILLDVMMDKMSGFEMAQHLRAHNDDTPIIFLTALDSHNDQMAGFALGGDDYITKPFAFDTVLARVKAVLKRTQSTSQSNDTLYVFGNLQINTSQETVTLCGETIELTRREYMTLCLLAQSPNKYFTREDILTKVGPNDVLVNDRSVDVHITRLRKKLGNEGGRIINKTGFGYALKS